MQIADENEALLMTDMAHISGLVAHGVVANPFPYSVRPHLQTLFLFVRISLPPLPTRP